MTTTVSLPRRARTAVASTTVLSASGSHCLIDIVPTPQLRARHEALCYQEFTVSNVPVLSCQQTCTPNPETMARSMLHCEGGWPRSVDTAETEDMLKYCKRALRDDACHATVQDCLERLHGPLRINAAIDIFQRYTFVPRGAATTLSAAATITASGAADSTASGGGTLDAATSASADDPAAPVAAPVIEQEESEVTLARQRVTTAFGHEELRSVATLTTSWAPEAARLAASTLAWQHRSDGAELAVGYVTARRDSFAGEPPPVSRGDSAPPAPCVCMWDAASPGAPTTVLRWKYGDVSTVSCSPRDAFVVGAGSMYGTVALWDVRDRSSGLGRASSLLEGHRGAVTAIRFLLGKSLELVTCGTDGIVRFWDARGTSLQPLDSFYIPRDAVGHTGAGMPGGTSAMRSRADLPSTTKTRPPPVDPNAVVATASLSSMDFDSLVGGPNKLLLGTAEGTIIACHRRGKSAAAGGGGGGAAAAASSPVSSPLRESPHGGSAGEAFASLQTAAPLPSAEDRISSRVQAHYSRIVALMRLPWHPKAYVSVGDWCARVFSEDVRSALLTTPFAASQFTSAALLPVRPTVLVLGSADGTVTVRPLLGYAQGSFGSSIKVSSGRVTAVAPQPSGRLCAATEDANGTVPLLVVPRRLCEPERGEKAQLAYVLERLGARERSAGAQSAASDRKALRSFVPSVASNSGPLVTSAEWQTRLDKVSHQYSHDVAQWLSDTAATQFATSALSQRR